MFRFNQLACIASTDSEVSQSKYRYRYLFSSFYRTNITSILWFIFYDIIDVKLS